MFFYASIMIAMHIAFEGLRRDGLRAACPRVRSRWQGAGVRLAGLAGCLACALLASLICGFPTGGVETALASAD